MVVAAAVEASEKTHENAALPVEHWRMRSATDKVSQRKRQRLQEEGKDFPEPDVNGMVPMQWTFDHEGAFANAGLTYRPAHENELRHLYAGHADIFYQSLVPRFQECVLYFDEKDPLPHVAEDEKLTDEYLLDLRCWRK